MRNWIERAKARKASLGFSNSKVDELMERPSGSYRDMIDRGTVPSIDNATRHLSSDLRAAVFPYPHFTLRHVHPTICGGSKIVENFLGYFPNFALTLVGK